MEELIKSFLTIGDGYGNGNGYGNGYGDGNGSLLSVTKVGDDKVYNIDDLPTAIDNIKGNVAHCRILKADMTWETCFVVRVGDCFAHGETIHEAQHDAMQKHMSSAPLEELLQMFKDRFPSAEEKIPAKELFDWHNTLTGSCLMGRKQWCIDHNIDVDHDSFTVQEFITLTQDSYGGESIKKLEKLY